MVKRLAIRLLWVVVVTCALSMPVGAAQVASPAAGGIDPDWPLSDAFLASFDGEFPESMPRYEIDVALDPGGRTLSGSLEVEYVNHTGQSLDDVPFRLFPNAEYYGDGGLTVEAVTVDGEAGAAELSVFDTVLTIPLGRQLDPDDSVTIGMAFETVVPADSPGSFGIFSHDTLRQTWILADWYPILAGWDTDTGWGLEPPTIWGDPTFSETSIYDVRLAVPAGMSVVSTGEEELASRSAAVDHYQILTGPARELTLVLDDHFVTTELMAGDVAIELHLDEATSPEGAEALLELAAATVATYSEWFGEYPYRELDIVETELAGALGVSWTGLLFIDAAGLERGLATTGNPEDVLTFTLIHEIGHQWWGSVVGVNSNDHTYLNESMTNYLTILVYEEMFGDVAAEMALTTRLAIPYIAYLEQYADGVVDRPVGDVESTVAFGRLVYGKGGLGMLAIHLEIGDDAFYGAIAGYRDAYAFQLAHPEDLLAAFEDAADLPLGPLWSCWFKEASTTIADVELLLSEAGTT